MATKRGKPKGASNVTVEERRRMRIMFAAGVRIAEIARRTGRSEATVAVSVRGRARNRPRPRPARVTRNAARDDRILQLVESGKTHREVARQLGLTPAVVGYAVRHHPKLLRLLRSGKLGPMAIATTYRLELSTALRLAGQPAKRTRFGEW
jgi:DNA-binding NarL/FixJ family response regulator